MTTQSRDTRGGGGRPGTRRFSGRRRRQCVCKEVGTVDYKDISVLRRFISDRGRIESGRKSGNCAKCQRELSTAISRARFLGLLPYAPNHTRVTGSITPAVSASSSDEEADSTEEKPEEESAESTAEASAAEETETEESSSEESDDESEDTSASVESSEETEDSPDDADEEDDAADVDSDDSEESDEGDDEEKS